MERLQGTVSVWLPARAFGFAIVVSPNGRDAQKYFVHVGQFTDPNYVNTVEVGHRIEFGVSPIREGKNPTAVNITRVDEVGQ